MREPLIYPPGYFLGAVILMVALHVMAPGRQWLFFPWNLTALVLLLAGLRMTGGAARLFSRKDTAIKPFAPPSTLVREGTYLHSRNPMYLGLVLMLMAIAALLGSLTPWLVIPTFAITIYTRFIVHEERMLEEQFGEEYREYCKQVGRWL